ncbi:uncharacterized protein LOC124948633 isoform X2 [Vespa velutina]|uniref:uncharacterized protein LOC124948633 isoform X2 n=1 Tax=Vespa velutina TaxID=202808 RepID=UPI001FB1DE79|nr:uncharacterized protein LOC124948633 isoform X2 [Vespa velutina]
MEADKPIIEEWTDENTFPNLEPFKGICETNRYHLQNVHKYKANSKQGNCLMFKSKKFVRSILMRQIRKENIKKYWFVDPYLATSSKLMSRNRTCH